MLPVTQGRNNFWPYFFQKNQKGHIKMSEDKNNKLAARRVEMITKANDLNVVVAEAASIYAESLKGNFLESVSLAIATSKISELLSNDMVRAFMSLQGKSYGFRTDRDYSGGYSEADVKSVAIEASLMGVPLVGNNVNIIGKNCYITRNGFSYLISKLMERGVIEDFNFEIEPLEEIVKRGQTSNNRDILYAKIKCHATWKQDGKLERVDKTVMCKGDTSSTDDAYAGKAERKLKKACYEKMTGIALNDGDASDSKIEGQDEKRSPFEKAKQATEIEEEVVTGEVVQNDVIQEVEENDEIDYSKLPSSALTAAVNSKLDDENVREAVKSLGKPVSKMTDAEKLEILNSL